ncbi:flavin reductase family protein [Bradyrhizobium sp. UFLA01-814]|uniref:flavin reductase family protein n=1 Tax=Bradyrhizobium sp. UFLA01-814 TaxID=3023480 RepID=UPI00398B27A8
MLRKTRHFARGRAAAAGRIDAANSSNLKYRLDVPAALRLPFDGRGNAPQLVAARKQERASRKRDAGAGCPTTGGYMAEREGRCALRNEHSNEAGQASWELEGGSDADVFRTAMRRMVGGVTVIATRHAGRPWGMTVSAFTPVCMDPPTLLVCVNSRTVTASDILRDGRFAVNLLSQAQLHVSQLCSAAGSDKYVDDHVVPAALLPSRVVMPILRDSTVSFDCKVAEVRPVGSHNVVIAIIESILAPMSRRPLLYGEGKYLRGVGIDDFATVERA